jgi:glycosyltransferase involved in cell wall biosynthesis
VVTASGDGTARVWDAESVKEIAVLKGHTLGVRSAAFSGDSKGVVTDVFVLASRFEGYGMALAEAIAHGLPVVSTMAGAIPDTVPAGTGLLVPPDDTATLAQALRRLISDRAERQRLATNARAAAARLPTWQDSARLFAGAVETVG